MHYQKEQIILIVHEGQSSTTTSGSPKNRAEPNGINSAVKRQTISQESKSTGRHHWLLVHI